MRIDSVECGLGHADGFGRGGGGREHQFLRAVLSVR
jgi:hypothetical protein